MATFGNTEGGTGGGLLAFWVLGMKREFIQGVKDSPTNSGKANKITCYVKENHTPYQEAMCALYLGSDKSFIASTQTRIISGASYDWKDFEFANPVDITVQDYYICVYGNAPDVDPGTFKGYSLIAYTDDLDVHDYQDNVADYPNWPDPHTFSVAVDAGHIQLYCTYTESAGGGTTHISTVGDGKMSTYGLGKFYIK